MSEEHKKQLEQQLWNVADTLRGKMAADQFRDYILWFIFYKYLSERLTLRANKLLEDEGVKYEDVDETTSEWKEILGAIREETIDDLGYFLKPSELFSEITKRGNSTSSTGESNFILWDLITILKNIEQSTTNTDSEEDFIGLFEDLDLTHPKLGNSEKAKNELISKVLSHLAKIDFKLEDTEIDVIGDAYEYLIAQFASNAGKKAGEFYTPQEVSQILAGIVTTNKSKLKNIYDPTCGSWSLLLRVAKQINNPQDVTFYGQELNRATYNLARMNMILHWVHFSKFDIRQEDTLEHPQHKEKKFEAIIANPPFSIDWSASQLHLQDDRFSQYGKLAPKSKADYAFIQHMIHHLDENGTMAVVLPHGVLFRSSTELHIRRYLIENKNYLDAVIGLPANIFYGTSIPTCILVFKKCRENPEDVLFIDASQHFEKAKSQNRLRKEDIDKIITSYKERKQEEKYSYVASLSEIEENDFNLNIPRYVDTFEEEEPINIDEVADEIKKLDTDWEDLDIKIWEFCKELGIKTPF